LKEYAEFRKLNKDKDDETGGGEGEKEKEETSGDL